MTTFINDRIKELISWLKMSTSLTDIIENTKLGREFALLGNYESSLVYYQGVLQQINRLLVSLTDDARIHLWQEVSVHRLDERSIESGYFNQ